MKNLSYLSGEDRRRKCYRIAGGKEKGLVEERLQKNIAGKTRNSGPESYERLQQGKNLKEGTKSSIRGKSSRKKNRQGKKEFHEKHQHWGENRRSN